MGSTALLGGMFGAFGKMWGNIAKVDAKKFTGDIVKDLEKNSEFIRKSDSNITKWLDELNEGNMGKYEKNFNKIQLQLTEDMENTMRFNELHGDAIARGDVTGMFE